MSAQQRHDAIGYWLRRTRNACFHVTSLAAAGAYWFVTEPIDKVGTLVIVMLYMATLMVLDAVREGRKS